MTTTGLPTITLMHRVLAYGAGRNARGTCTLSQAWGSEFMMVAVVVAAMQERGLCATAENVAPLAGCSRATAGSRMRRMSEAADSSVLQRWVCRKDASNAHKRAHHYGLSFRVNTAG